MAVNLQPNPNVPPITPPPSNMPNSFPRIYIGYTESILYETKPKMRGFFFIIIMIFSIFPIPIVISGILFSSLSADYLILLFLLLAFPIIIFLF